MNNEDTNQIINKKLILTAFEKQLELHIVLKDKTWRNGIVKEVLADFFMFKDRENPIEPFFYIEVKDVKPYVKEEKK